MNKTCYKRILLVFLCMATLFSSGCAGPSCPIEKFPYQTLSFGNIGYFALIDMCQKEEVAWDYDPLSQVVVLSEKDNSLKLMIGSRKVIADGRIFDLSGPVVLKDSVVYAPLDLRFLIHKFLLGIMPQEAKEAYPYRSVKIVILDAGHGGKDPGAVGRGGLQEKRVVLDVAAKIKKCLEAQGLKVYMTRSNDSFIPLPERSRMANNRKGDIFVSIHANANHSRSLEGFEVYYLTDNFDDDARALNSSYDIPKEVSRQAYCSQPSYVKAILWDMIYSRNRMESVRLAQFISREVSEKMNLNMLGIKGAAYNVLRGTRMPAVLVEIGYISNAEGEKKLADGAYRNEIAKTIAEGILNYKKYAEERGR